MNEQTLTVSSRPYTRSWILLLALLTALAPLSTDMYLPALPVMAQMYGTNTEMMSNSLPAYFIGLALGQLLYGPISDRFGRKKPLLFGLGLHILASLLCVYAPSAMALLWIRVLQALGGCVGLVIARAAIRDCLPTAFAAQAFASMMIVMGVAPIVAPMLGSWILAWFDWQAIFWVLVLLGCVCWVWVWMGMEETLPADKRLPLTFGQALSTYKTVLSDAAFLWPMLAVCFSFSVLFSYIIAAPAVLMGHFSLTQQQFAYVFGFNAIGTMLLSACNHRLQQHFSVLKRLQLGVWVQLLGTALLLVASLSGGGLLWVMAGLFVSVAGIGLTAPNATALAMSQQGKNAGSASALIGSIQFGFGFLCGMVMAVLPWGSLVNMACLMLAAVLCSAVAILKMSPLPD